MLVNIREIYKNVVKYNLYLDQLRGKTSTIYCFMPDIHKNIWFQFLQRNKTNTITLSLWKLFFIVVCFPMTISF